jgi:hypothetical protein
MIERTIAPLLRSHLSSDTKKVLRRFHERLLSAVGYDQEQWVRIVQRREWHEFLLKESARHPHVLEISAGDRSPWRAYATGSYTAPDYPQFDICRDTLPRTFDIVIAEQVFEHLCAPDAAARNVRAMMSDSGVLLIATPFLLRLHGRPYYGDFTRWSPEGLKMFLVRNGFSRVTTNSWGNRRAVRSNFRDWASFGWGRDLRNEPDFPIVVWAYASA